MSAPAPQPPEPGVSFGAHTVARAEKPALVQGVFSRVAANYDRMNDAMSFGLHRLWKRQFVRGIHPRKDMHLLDLAGGTGDISFRFLDTGGGYATICDYTPPMLVQGRMRAVDRNTLRGLDWVCGDAQSLPFPDHTFDACTMAFGLRNVTDIPLALKEIHRVLKRGAAFHCLEFSHISAHPLKELYAWYSAHIIPALGERIAHDRASYEYLVESIKRFPAAPQLASMFTQAGFSNTAFTRLNSGIVAIHRGWKV